MKTTLIALITAATLLTGTETATAQWGNPYQQLDGQAFVVAEDGTFLGIISSDRYDQRSICNAYGDHGSPYATNSVRNEYGNYGSPYAANSAYNEYTNTPPMIVMNRQVVGHLTKNEYLTGAIDPDVLLGLFGCLN